MPQISQESVPAQPPVSGDDFVDQYYKLLTAPEPPLAERTATAETERDPRLIELFAPHLTRQEAASQRPEKPESDEQTDSQSHVAEYSRLLAGDLPKPETLSERLKREALEAKYATPTEPQRQDAYVRLREAIRDPNIKDILDTYAPTGSDLSPESLVDTIRTSADIRYELGSYFLREKIPRLRREHSHTLPERLHGNSGKTPNHKGYGLSTMNSPEYAAVLALSMLDGTFERVGRTGDPIHRLDNGRVELGQHRAAAAVLLAADPYKPNLIEETLFR